MAAMRQTFVTPIRTAQATLAIGAATLLGIFGFTPSAWALEVNLAPLGTATASRTDFGATVLAGIDGNRDGNFGNGSVFYGNADPLIPPLYYQVDLGVDAYIDRIQILRRSDADQGVFGNMRLTIYDDDGSGQPGAVTFTKDYLTGDFGSGGFEYGTWGTTDPGLASTQGTHGRHVRLERIDNNYWLTFAEFEVLGSTSPLAFTDANNIVLGKSVTTSSAPGFNSLITSANDGNIDGNFGTAGYRPVYHSSTAAVGEYWQVDLGSATQLDHIQLFSRTDNFTTSEFKVSVLDASQAVVGSFVVENKPANDPSPVYDLLVNTAGMSGQYIRVETTKNESLAFAELRAWTGPGSVLQPADFNHDGHVDDLDLAKWRGDFGVNAGSDANLDGASDGDDFLAWQRQLGVGGAVVAQSTIPEPSTIAMLGAILPSALRVRKRRARRAAA